MMKLILAAGLLLTSAVVHASVDPMTMSCEINYSVWKSLNDPYTPSEDIKIRETLKPVKIETGIHRFLTKAVKTTSDGRYVITADAIQPLKGDALSLKMVRVQVLDTVSKVDYEVAYPDILDPRKDILDATALVTYNLDAKNPNEPGNQLKVVCKLR